MPSYVAKSEVRSPIAARLRPDDYKFFCERAEAAGLAPAHAARAIIELVIHHMRRSGNYIDTLVVVNRALKGNGPT